MSERLTSSRLLKLAFFALLTPQFVFSSGKLLESDDKPQKVVAVSLFERFPSEVISLILDKLPRKDLINLRAVEKKLRDVITPIITNVTIPGNLPNEEQVYKFFTDLTTVEYWEEKKPSEAFVNLFRYAPVEILQLSNQTISAEGIATIAPILPIGLKTLELNNSNIGDAGVQALAPHLPATFTELHLNNSNIGDAGVQALASHFPATLETLLLNNNNIGDAGVQALASHLPANLQKLWLENNNIGDEGLAALLVVIPKTDLKHLSIPIPSNLLLLQHFTNLYNRQGSLVTIGFF